MHEPEVVGLGQEKTRSEEAERGSSKRDGRGLVRGWGTGGAGLGAQLDCGLMNGAAGCLLSILSTLFSPPSRLPLGTKKVRGVRADLSTGRGFASPRSPPPAQQWQGPYQMRRAWSKTCQWLFDHFTSDADVQGIQSRSPSFTVSPDGLCASKIDVSVDKT